MSIQSFIHEAGVATLFGVGASLVLSVLAWREMAACAHTKRLAFDLAQDGNQLISALRQAELDQQDLEAFSRSVLNSLTAHVAVLDQQGAIVAVNQAWRRFGEANGAPESAMSPLGVNYPQVCLSSVVGPSGEVAIAAHQGIRAVLDGTQSTFELEYPCHSPFEERWFSMSVTRLKGPSAGAVVSHHDITAIKLSQLAQQKLAEREEIYRTIVTQATESIAVIDMETRTIVEFNDATCAMLGYSRAELSMLRASDIRVDVEGDVTAEERVQQLYAVGSGDYDGYYRHKDGSVRTLHLRNKLIHSSGRKLLVTVMSDVTERKASEHAMKNQNAHLESVVSQRTDDLQRSAAQARSALIDLQQQQFVLDEHAIVSMCSLDGRITYCNQRFSQISGYSREELIGQDHAILNSGHHPHGFFKAMYETVARGEVWSGEICNRARDGHLYWVASTVAVFLGEDGRPREYIAVRTDITERMKSGQALSQSVATLNATLEATSEGILVVSRDGRLERWNQKFIDLWNMPISFLDGQERLVGLAHMMAQVIDATVVQARIKELYAHPQDSSVDLLHLIDGRTFLRHSQPQRIGNDIVGRVWSFADITEQRKSEQAALTAAQTKAAFLANMSHEIRTPMNGVIGMVDILMQSSLAPEQRRMLDTIHNSAQALLHIINDILDFSKIEADKLEVESVPTHLREVVEGSALLVVSAVGAKGVDLTVFVAPELPHWIACDPTRLRQVLINLLGNAAKFTRIRDGQAPRIMLFVEPCNLADARAGVRFRVTDDGIGMSEQMLAKLFQPFSQADASTARKFGGTGLGLSISRRLVELMGGTISVKSTEGAGSEFEVTLPLHGARSDSMPVFEPRLEGVHVLGVTRDEASHRIIVAYCGAAGARVAMVPDLAAARHYLQQTTPAGPTVVMLGPIVTTPTDALELPAGVGVVRMVRRNSQAFAGDIRLNVRPALYIDMLQAVAIASGRLTAPETPHQSPATSAAAPAALEVEDARRCGRLILVAEDNETNRDVIQEQLRLLGYTCEMAEDGAIALNMWGSGHYALLLTDCHMPDMDGFELTQAIRQGEAPGTRMPIIAITADAMEGSSGYCREMGMDDYLSKPMRLNELGPMLAKWMPLPDVAAYRSDRLGALHQPGQTGHTDQGAQARTHSGVVGVEPLHLVGAHQILLDATGVNGAQG